MLESLPQHILEKIASNLHWTDLVALEMLNHHLRRMMRGDQNQGGVWTRIGAELILHSFDQPLNLLSMRRWNCKKGAPQFRLNNRQLKEIFERCGKHRLLTVDLGLHRTIEQYPYLRNRLNGVCHLLAGCIRLNGSVCHLLAGCTRLSTLDLSGIRLKAVLLVTIARACGQTLRTVRLMGCFSKIYDPPRMELFSPNYIPTAEQFDEFLRGTPFLEHLNIAGCDLNEFDRVLCFASISTRLRTFISDVLLPQQMIQIVRNCGRTLRCLMVFFNDEYSEEQKRNIFGQIESLEQLWLSNRDQPSQITFPANFAAIKTLKRLTLGRFFLFNEILNDSFLRAQSQALLQLEELEMRGEIPLASASKPESWTTALSGVQMNNWCRLAWLTPNLTQLRLNVASVNDDALQKIAAALGRLEELSIIGCPLASWKGLAAFVRMCPNLHLLGQAEQMTDELLELVMATMDSRAQNMHLILNSLQSANSAEDGHHGRHQKLPLFYFIRFPLISHNLGHTPMNVSSVQSHSQNMHPAIVWRQERADPPIDSVEEMFNRCM